MIILGIVDTWEFQDRKPSFMAAAGPASGVHLCPWGTKTKDLGPQSGQFCKSLGDPKGRMAYFPYPLVI